MIPKELIYDKTINENRIIVYSYFALKQGLDDTVGFSCNHIVNWCGYTVDYHKNRSNDKIKKMIHKLSDIDYLKLEGDISSDIFSIAELNSDKFYPDSQFALIYIDEINKMCNFKKYTEDTNKMNAAILILVLSYIRVNLLRRQNGYIGKKQDKPEFCYRMYIDIERDIGISNRYISRSVKILQELDLIVSQEMKRYKDDYNNWHTGVTLFVNKDKRNKGGECLDVNYDYKQEIEWGIEYINDKKYKNKKFNQDI